MSGPDGGSEDKAADKAEEKASGETAADKPSGDAAEKEAAAESADAPAEKQGSQQEPVSAEAKEAESADKKPESPEVDTLSDTLKNPAVEDPTSIETTVSAAAANQASSEPVAGQNDDAEPSTKRTSAESEGSEQSASSPNKDAASSLTLTQHHVSHLLSDVLQDDSIEETPALKGIRFPMIFDCLLGLGLLFAVGGFTVGLFHMYIVHSASQYISEQKYDKAITVLKGAPLPQVFSRTGSDTEELLSKACYLDAMDKIESNKDIEIALKELSEIHPGSKYFALAQEAIGENTEPAPIMLQGGAETTETASPNSGEGQSLLDKTLKEEEKK